MLEAQSVARPRDGFRLNSVANQEPAAHGVSRPWTTPPRTPEDVSSDAPTLAAIAAAWDENIRNFPRWLARAAGAALEDVKWLLFGPVGVTIWALLDECLATGNCGAGGINQEDRAAERVVNQPPPGLSLVTCVPHPGQ